MTQAWVIEPTIVCTCNTQPPPYVAHLYHRFNNKQKEVSSPTNISQRISIDTTEYHSNSHQLHEHGRRPRSSQRMVKKTANPKERDDSSTELAVATKHQVAKLDSFASRKKLYATENQSLYIA